MRKIAAVCSIVMIVLGTSSCQKEEMVINDPMSGNLKKGGAGQTASTIYGGQATAIDATIWNTQNAVVTSTQTVLAQTSPLPAAGGTEAASYSQANIQGVILADMLSASTTGQNGSTSSVASATNLSITVGGNTITASAVQANASASCGSASQGSSQFSSLVVNGVTISVTGLPNQAIYLQNGGFIIINEQSASKKGGLSTINVSAIHVILPNAADIRVATAKAEIKC